MDQSRRDFVQAVVVVGAGAGLVPLVGCGDDDGTPGTDAGPPARTDGGARTDAGGVRTDAGEPGEDAGEPGEDAGEPEVDAGGPAPSCDTLDIEISGHPHMVTIPAAHVLDPMDRMYTLTGSGHEHTLMLTAAQFMSLGTGGTVMATATGSGHTHEVTLSCE
jgi:hypothetical protein